MTDTDDGATGGRAATGRRPLPDGFLIGASTSPHQIEGGNVASDWWRLEHRPGSPLPEPSGDAADSYHRWREDLEILAELGLDAYRFGIEWARIEPADGEISRAQVAHYGRIVAACRDLGIEPVVTLHHFTNPAWFSRGGGWTQDGATERFLRYVEAVLPVLADGDVRWVVTINEPNMVSVMATAARLMSGGTDLDDLLGDGPAGPLPPPDPATRDALVAAHHAAVDVLTGALPDALVGWSVAEHAVQSVPGGEDAAAAYREAHEESFLRPARGDGFVGVQSYTRNVFGPEGVVREDPEEERTQMGWEHYPAALGEAVEYAASVVGDVPVLVTENGIATADDERRISYTAAALDGLLDVTAPRRGAAGVDVRGYLHWSLLDNYEWGSFRPTFGLVGWDPVTFDRTPKRSARWLGEVARTRGVPGP
ncbi:family 1 glycosylhydrolase [Dermatobacter hominis]|uniref:family 1 glycosylhydrolase n=1 Tax=Dermatobacter hominis TaxID=2884263 RepID=UPI001D11E45C|nr:family 1 glycosylhydrolase [Dermatobacter hominis]UDY34317.1 family 1 glycosylhydrolase [Dermatobacter hominis]